MNRALPVQTCARIAGVLLLLSFMGGGFGEAYVPSKLIVSDPGVTARNLLSAGPLFRWGFAGYLVEALCDVGLTWVFYVLLRPVHRDLALLAAGFRLISTAGFAVGEAILFAAFALTRNPHALAAFSPAQIDALLHLLLRIGLRVSDVFSLFYGAGTIALGLLVSRSRFLPALLGHLWTISGVAFVVSTFVTILAPAYRSPFFMLPIFVAGLALMVWLLVRGVDPARWHEWTVGEEIPRA